jgi:hypothetical protein
MTDKEIEQAARACVAGSCINECPLSDNLSCLDEFADYIFRHAEHADKEPMIRDIPDYEEDKAPNGVEVLDVIRKALEEHYAIEIMSVSATDNDARLTFAVGELPYSVSFEGG